MTSTKPIPLFGKQESAPTTDCLRNLAFVCGQCHYAPLCDVDTLPILSMDGKWHGSNFVNYAARNMFQVQAAMVAALVELRRAVADDEITRPFKFPGLKASANCHETGCLVPYLYRKHSAVPFRPFYGGEAAEKPMELRWNKARRRIRAAAKEYSEQTHADY